MRTSIVLLLFLSSLSVFGFYEPLHPTNRDSGAWHLVHEDHALTVYRRHSPVSAIDDIRIKATFTTGMEHFLKVLGDVPAYTSWVYKCSESRLLATPAAGEQVYYARTAFPWPLEDRDLIVHSMGKRNDATGVFTSTSTAVPRYQEAVFGVVRIKTFTSSWTITPIANGQVAVDYRVSCDPGGSLPDWAVNLGVSSGPRKTMEALRKLVETAK